MVAGAAVVSLAALGGFPETAMAAAPGWVGPVKLVLDPILLYFEFAFVARIVLSWYPAVSGCEKIIGLENGGHLNRPYCLFHGKMMTINMKSAISHFFAVTGYKSIYCLFYMLPAIPTRAHTT